MIQLTRIAGRIDVACPHCQAPLLAIEEHASWVIGGGYWMTDGDTIPIYRALRPEQRAGIGFNCVLDVGDCAHCKRQYVGISATFVDAEPDDEFTNT